MKRSAIKTALVFFVLAQFTGPFLAAAQGAGGIKDAKGNLFLVAVEGLDGRSAVEAFRGAIQKRLNSGLPDLEARAFLTTGENYTAETVLGIPEEERRNLGVLLELRFVPSESAEPKAVVEVYRYPFGAIAKEHVRSPEYSFKFGSDSALFAIEMHRLSAGRLLGEAGAEVTTGARAAGSVLGRLELSPATHSNPSLPTDILRKTVVLTVAAPDSVSGDRADALAGLLADAFVAFQGERGSFVMGVVSDKARKRGAPEKLSIIVTPYMYKNGETQGQNAKSVTLAPFPSGLYYFDSSTTLTAYSYVVEDPGASTLRRKVDEGGFVTSSMEGIVRTVPVKLAHYTPLENKAATESESVSDPVSFDTVIEGATVFDGTKDHPRFSADVGIVGERIAAVGNLKGKARKQTIDGTGLFLMPGFIDIHSHGDWNVLRVPYAPSHVRQGITTILGGNCASSPLGIGAFLDEVGEKGAAVNIGVLVGNKPIRLRVMGKSKGMFPYDELYREKELVDLAMEEGAFGMSSGLIYSTSEEAFAWELAAMAKQIKPYGGFYASHVRGETDEVLDAIREAIYIGELAEVPVEISHMKVLAKRNWGDMKDYIAIMKSARARGLDVTGDQYPWRASGPAGHYRLYRLLVREAIGNDAPDVVLLKDMPGKYARYSGRPLTELLEGEHMTPEELIKDLNLTRDSKIYATYLCIGPDDVLLPMKEDFVSVCTDASLVSLKAIESGRVWDEHPRKFRSYPEFFAKYVRDRQVCSWEMGVYKCTGLPAWRMKLTDRGVIKPGAFADLVLLDPERLDPAADYRDQAAPPKGIPYVFINGRAVVAKSELTKVRAGKPLYGYGHRKP